MISERWSIDHCMLYDGRHGWSYSSAVQTVKIRLYWAQLLRNEIAIIWTHLRLTRMGFSECCEILDVVGYFICVNVIPSKRASRYSWKPINTVIEWTLNSAAAIDRCAIGILCTSRRQATKTERNSTTPDRVWNASRRLTIVSRPRKSICDLRLSKFGFIRVTFLVLT